MALVIATTILVTALFIATCYLLWLEHDCTNPARNKINRLDSLLPQQLKALDYKINRLAETLGYIPPPDESIYGPPDVPSSRIVDNTNESYDSQDIKDAWDTIRNASVGFSNTK
jgi:hypothetical protein